MSKKEPSPGLMSPHALWRPRRPELPKQCVSCPFLKGNDKEFKAVFEKICSKHGGAKVTAKDLMNARVNVRVGVLANPEFYCHGTAYDKDMNVRPLEEQRQCPGASKLFREQKQKEW